MRPRPIMSPTFLVLPSWLSLLLVAVVGLTTCSAAKVNGTNSIPDPELVQVFKQLSGVNTPIWRPNLGGQNYTACCLKAINEAITVTVNGSLVFTDDSYTSWITFNNNTTPLDALKDYDAQGQFPCTAAYNGNADGAPMVQVTYQWLSDTCPGWQISSKDNLNAWLQPLSGFLIPAIVFCISVPRRRMLELPRSLFSSDQSGVQGYFLLPVGVPIAVAMVTADTLIWLCLCFAFSGPMIVSGLYEAMLDNRVIDYVKGKINEKQLTLDMRCRCLMLVLIGNLDLVWSTENRGPVGIDAFKGTQNESQQNLIPQGRHSSASIGLDYQRQDGGHALHNMTAARSYQGGITPGMPSTVSTSPRAHFSVVPQSPYNDAYGAPPQPPGVPPRGPAEHTWNYWSRPVDSQPRPLVPNVTFPSTSTGSQDLGQPLLTVDIDEALVTGYPSAARGPSQGLPYGPAPYVQSLRASGAILSDGTSALDIAADGASAAQPPVSGKNSGPPASPWQHMERFLYDLRLYPDENTSRDHSPRQNPYPCRGCSSYLHNEQRYGICTHDKSLINRHPYTIDLIQKVKTRLKTMLHCQYSFGSVVGAPVVFFLGGFVFALLQSLDTLGDEDIAEGLAFGQWYMTIPHIAIVSGLLLAGNNPNILEGVLAVDSDTYPADKRKFLGLNYGLAYPSCYKVASLWDRGHNKKMWLDTLINTYLVNKFDDEDKDIRDLERRTTLRIVNWVFLLVLAISLLGIPFLLAFLTAFYTPEIGLSCRSLTFLIYFCVQTMQIWLWMWAYAGPLPRLESRDSDARKHAWFGVGGRLDRLGFYMPYSTHWLYQNEVYPSPGNFIRQICGHPERMWSLGFLWNLMYYLSQYILGLIGIMAAIGGTLMQLMGVYTANICYITTEYWFLPYSQRGMALLSRNSAEMIENAQLIVAVFWKPCAIAGISFMSLVSFIGWWYQRRMRNLFTRQVLRIDDTNYDREKDTEISRAIGAQWYGTKFDSRLVSLSAFNPQVASSYSSPHPAGE